VAGYFCIRRIFTERTDKELREASRHPATLPAVAEEVGARVWLLSLWEDK
jgi:hypothetical protein